MRKLFISAVLQLLVICAFAQQQPRFFNDVQTIKAYDKIYKTSPDPIVFVGSSSIRLWKNLHEVFGTYNVINRGIGGAVTNDITFYLNDIVFPYQPRQIVIYVGENDLPSPATTPDSVLNRTVRLFESIRAKLPQTPIVYISMKPSPSREKFQQKAKEANNLIKEYISKQDKAVFVDVFPKMLAKDGKPNPKLFVKDMLHMNADGYAIWEKAVKPHLIKR